jgi:hypothetical protein
MSGLAFSESLWPTLRVAVQGHHIGDELPAFGVPRRLHLIAPVSRLSTHLQIDVVKQEAGTASHLRAVIPTANNPPERGKHDAVVLPMIKAVT